MKDPLEIAAQRLNAVLKLEDERDALQAKLNILEREHREAIAKLSSERDALSKERDDMQADFNWLTEEGCFRNERFIVTHESWNTFRPVGLRTCIAKARSGVMGEYLGPEVQPASEFMTATQCCDPMIDSKIGELLEENKALRKERDGLLELMNTPEIEDFDKAVPLEAAHQVQRWTAAHDAGKKPSDWFWLVGYLAGKALHASASGDTDKAKHHCISTAAALRNWHAHIRSGTSAMRPGISAEVSGEGPEVQPAGEPKP